MEYYHPIQRKMKLDEIESRKIKEYKNSSISDSFLNYEQAAQVSKWTKTPKDFLIFMGCKGAGKTHALAAILNYMFDKHERKGFIPDISAYSFYYIFSELKKEFNYKETPTLMPKLFDKRYLGLDDFGAHADSEWKQEVVFSIIDSRWTSRLPTIITTNLTMQEISERLGDRIYSRLADTRNIILEKWDTDHRQRD